MNVSTILAQPAPATNPANPKPPYADVIANYFPFLLIIGVMVFLMFRTKSKDEKKRKELMNSLKKGDEVQTIGGIIGKVVEVRDNEVVVKVDESTNTKMRFRRSAIGQVLTQEKSEAK